MDVLAVPLLSAAVDFGLNTVMGNNGNAVIFGKTMSTNSAQAISTGISAFIAQSTKHLVIPKIPASESSRKLIVVATPPALCGAASAGVNYFFVSGKKDYGMQALNSAISYAVSDYGYRTWSGKGGYRV